MDGHGLFVPILFGKAFKFFRRRRLDGAHGVVPAFDGPVVVPENHGLAPCHRKRLDEVGIGEHVREVDVHVYPSILVPSPPADLSRMT